MSARRMLILAGEASGDAHGARLVRSARRLEPELQVVGMGGPALREAGVRTVVDSAEVAVVGLVEVLAHLRSIIGAFLRLRREVLRDPPDLAVLIDFPDFNLLFARVLKRAGVPVVYYISPQIWAWRRGRVSLMRKLVRRMLVIFPFEEAFYSEHRIDVRFVGHPLADAPDASATPEETRARLGVDADAPLVAVLPGSRRGEVAHILPDLLGACRRLRERDPRTRFVIPLADSLDRSVIDGYLEGSGLEVDVRSGMLAEVLSAADVGLVASGTATLDAARARLPMVVVYRISPLTYRLARMLVRGVEMFGMVNIVAGRKIVPELLQEEFTPERVAEEARAYLEDPELAGRTRAALGEVRRKLGDPGASDRAAELALDVAGREPRPSTMDLTRRLWPYVAPHKWKLRLAILAMLVAALMTAAPAKLLQLATDELFMKQNADLLYLLPAAVVVLFLLKGVAEFSESYLMNGIARRMITDLRADLFAKLSSLSLRFYQDHPTGTLLSRVTFDVQLIQTATVKSVVTAVKQVGTIVVLTITAFVLNWELSVIGLVVFPVAVIPIVVFGRRMRKASRSSQVTMGDLASHVHETSTGIRVVKAFRLESAMRGRFTAENERLFRLAMRMVRVQALSSPLMEVLASVGIAGVLLFGGHQVIDGGQTAGKFAAFVYVLLSLYKPVKDLSKVNNAIQEGMAAAERVFEVLDTEDDTPERPDAVELGRVRGVVDFHDVSFSYDDEPVIERFSLHVEPGTVVALVGPSGAGKSTIVNLVARFYDVTQGALRIDGTDVRDASLASLRAQIGLVDQQTFLFNDTVRANIGYGRPGAGQEDIERAARAAHADGFIRALPEGYDTVIGEQGVRLSGGQRQRISIARALLKDPPLLLLDEATSSLDSASEKEVQAALDELVKDRTTFVIAHRLSTIEHADRILVLEGGRIVEDGTHAELMAQGGAYVRLHRMQFQPSRDDEAAPVVAGGEAAH